MSDQSAAPKSEREIAREKAKAEKAAKFEAKRAKQQAQQQAPNGAPTQPKKEKKDAKVKETPSAAYKEQTPKGEKKILQPLDDEFHKAYIPSVVESAWYDWWEKQGYFKPEFTQDGKCKPKGSFVIMIPPPNVTGALHCGHALATALQDVMTRFQRMRGFTTLYLPGCDHAGISTQSVVENMLWRRQNKTRHDLGRAKFIDTVQDWKEEYHERINTVLRRLGASLDWSREAFTMSPELSRAVRETFVTLHEQGYIYRANRLVNWCTRLNTALSNLEVDNKELAGRTLLDVPGYERKVEFGVLTTFRYEVDGSDEKIEVATTRPETMLGDTGIAVHPDDQRYAHLVGKRAKHPFIEGRFMPIVADTYVDKDFGTGAVKLTPAHDPNDFELGKRHNLEFINILTDDGLINENGGPFAGQKRFDVRYTVTAELEKRGLFVKKEDNPMKVPLCTKSKDVIEPLIKPQWWMKMKEMSQAALDVVDKGEIMIKPQSAAKNYRNWMSNVNDWCLSRQLWWGHQIPAYFIHIEGETQLDQDDNYWVVARSEEEAKDKASERFPNKTFTLKQDPDVLDTWFSSGLWPWSTLGWPDDTQDLRELYPTSMLETGWDILFFWVARMIMLGLKMTGEVPFTEVYCHSLIRDSEGRKMSKSLGNVIDPVDILEGIDLQKLHDKLRVGNLDPKEIKNAEKYQKTAFPNGIPECGSDALRFSLVQYVTGGGDIAFDVKVMAAYRRFCNKIYQATKYVLGKIPSDFKPNKTGVPTGKESLAEKWILHKLAIATRDMTKALVDREFSRSTQIWYQYFYDHLCDIYIENSKSIIQDGTPEEQMSALQTLYTALEAGLKLGHPFMPFLTEELWQRLPRRLEDKTPSIMIAEYPEYEKEMDDPAAEAAYEVVIGCSAGIRSILGGHEIKEGGQAFVQALDPQTYKTAVAQENAIRTLASRALAELKILDPQAEKPKGCTVYPVSDRALVWVYVKGKIDVDKELTKAEGKLEKAKKEAGVLAKSYDAVKVSEASAAVIDTEEKRLRIAEAEVRALGDAIAQLKQLKLEG